MHHAYVTNWNVDHNYQHKVGGLSIKEFNLKEIAYVGRILSFHITDQGIGLFFATFISIICPNGQSSLALLSSTILLWYMKHPKTWFMKINSAYPNFISLWTYNAPYLRRGLATDSRYDVWGRGWTAYTLCGGPLLGYGFETTIGM